MTESMKVTVQRRDGIAVIYTDGYINNQGGEEIARVAYQLIDEGYRELLLNLERHQDRQLDRHLDPDRDHREDDGDRGHGSGSATSPRPSRRPSTSWASPSTRPIYPRRDLRARPEHAASRLTVPIETELPVDWQEILSGIRADQDWNLVERCLGALVPGARRRRRRPLSPATARAAAAVGRLRGRGSARGRERDARRRAGLSRPRAAPTRVLLYPPRAASLPTRRARTSCCSPRPKRSASCAIACASSASSRAIGRSSSRPSTRSGSPSPPP